MVKLFVPPAPWGPSLKLPGSWVGPAGQEGTPRGPLVLYPGPQYLDLVGDYPCLVLIEEPPPPPPLPRV